jgi:heat shock protein HslJ
MDSLPLAGSCRMCRVIHTCAHRLPYEWPKSIEQFQLELVLLKGQPLIQGTSITLRFQDDKIYGDLSCNSYDGPFYAHDKQLRLEWLEVTVVGCLPDYLNVQGQAYADALAAPILHQPGAYRLIKDGSRIQLEILDSNGEPMLVYEAASSSQTGNPSVKP